MAQCPLLVIDKIIAHLNFQDLLSIRSLSSDFNFCVIQRLSNRLYYVSINTNEKFSKFLNLVSNSTHHVPFSRFIMNPQVGSRQDLEYFSELYGEKIVKLSVSESSGEQILLATRRLSFNVNKEAKRNDMSLLHYLGYILKNASRLEVLQIAEANLEECEFTAEDSPPVPTLPALTLLLIHRAFQWNQNLWMLTLIRRAPVLQYASHWDYSQNGSDLYENEFNMRNIKSLLSYRGEPDKVDWLLRGFSLRTPTPRNVEKEDWLKAKARLRIPTLLIPRGTIWWDRRDDNSNRIAEDQARNAIALSHGYSRMGSDIPLTWKSEFPRVKEMLTTCHMWRTGMMRYFTPAHLPSLVRVIIDDGTEEASDVNPFPPSSVYSTVIELELDLCCEELGTPSWPWHQLFPNVRKLGLLSKQALKYLEHFLPKFANVETLSIRHANDTPEVKRLLSGGIPARVNLSHIKSLEYFGFGINELEGLVGMVLNSFQGGFLTALRRIIFISDEAPEDLKVPGEIDRLGLLVEVQWWVPGLATGGCRREWLKLSQSQPPDLH